MVICQNGIYINRQKYQRNSDTVKPYIVSPVNDNNSSYTAPPFSSHSLTDPYAYKHKHTLTYTSPVRRSKHSQKKPVKESSFRAIITIPNNTRSTIIQPFCRTRKPPQFCAAPECVICTFLSIIFILTP